MRGFALAACVLPALVAGRLFREDAYLEDVAVIADAPGALENLELRQAPAPAPAVPDAAQPAPIVPNIPPAAPPSAPENPAAPVNPAPQPAVPAPAPVLPQAPVITSTSITSGLTSGAVSSVASSPHPSLKPTTLAIAPGVTMTSVVVPAIPPILQDPNAPVMPADGINPILAEMSTKSFTNNGEYFQTVQWVETWFGSSQTWVPKTVVYSFSPFMTEAPLPGRGSIGMGTLTGSVGQTRTIGAAPTHAIGAMRGVAMAVGVGAFGLII